MSAMGLGCMGTSDACGKPDDEESSVTLDKMLDPVSIFGIPSGYSI